MDFLCQVFKHILPFYLIKKITYKITTIIYQSLTKSKKLFFFKNCNINFDQNLEYLELFGKQICQVLSKILLNKDSFKKNKELLGKLNYQIFNPTVQNLGKFRKLKCQILSIIYNNKIYLKKHFNIKFENIYLLV